MAETIKKVQKQGKLLDLDSTPGSTIRPIQAKLGELENLTFVPILDTQCQLWAIRKVSNFLYLYYKVLIFHRLLRRLV